MEEAAGSSYWCHVCSQTVNPIMEIETIKCPLCQGGFIEEMSSISASTSASATPGNESPLDSDNALSLWAPILLGMMADPSLHRRRLRRMEFQNEVENNDNNNHQHNNNGDSELDQELDSVMRRRRRSTAAILQLLQGIRAGMESDSNNDRESERVILINPFNQTIIVQGAANEPLNELQNRAPMGDYFIGTGLDLLLQHLSENDPNRYGTPPAKKEAIEALPDVKVEETLQCCVCLDDCEVGSQVKEMPCKHKFHDKCILSWLELHSSCPVCRHQLPCDESKIESESSNVNGNVGNGGGDERNGNGRRFSIPLLWPFSGLFSSASSSESGSGVRSPNSGLSMNEQRTNSSHGDEN